MTGIPHVSRRTFFRGATLGLGGLYLAPFLRQLDAATSAGSATPARVVFFVQGNGVYPKEIQPDGFELPAQPDRLEDRPLSPHQLAFSLQPLAPWKHRMTMIHGLSGRIARGSHNLGFAALGCWSVPEGEGNMMDNTLVVYLSDSAEGHHPNCREWPFVLIGDLGGRLQLGDRYLRYPWYGKPGHRTINSLYLTLLQAVGDPAPSFGLKDSALLDLDQDGPLAELVA